MKLKRVDHIGVLVDDLDQAKTFLSSTFGLKHVRDVDASAVGRKASFFRCGEIDIEVIEDLDPGAKAHNLGGQRAKVEHIAIQVDDLAATLAALAALGVRPERGPIQVGARLNAWTDADTTDGVVYQLLQEL